jgi:outer membrane protein, multidrug efflux system
MRQEARQPRSMHVILPFAAATILGGCAVGPDYQTAFLPMPASWSRTEGTKYSQPPELSHWWTRLRDPLLNQLIDEAVDDNLDVAAAKARIREARASYRQAVGALFPAVTNRESVIRSKGSVFSTSTNPVPGGGMSPMAGLNSPSTTYQTGFDASWELDLFGANRRAVEAAAYGIDASEENLRATLLTLVGDIASNYVQARGLPGRDDPDHPQPLCRRDCVCRRRRQCNRAGGDHASSHSGA